MLTLLVIYGLADDTFAKALIHGEWPGEDHPPTLATPPLLPLSNPVDSSSHSQRAKCVFILRNLRSSKRNCVRSNSNDQIESEKETDWRRVKERGGW